jgi:hypothetical protein
VLAAPVGGLFQEPKFTCQTCGHRGADVRRLFEPAAMGTGGQNSSPVPRNLVKLLDGRLPTKHKGQAAKSFLWFGEEILQP